MKTSLLFVLTVFSFAFAQAESKFDQSYKKIWPILENNCTSCHNADKKKGSLDFTAFKTQEDLYRKRKTWEMVIEQVMNDQMPPKKKKKLNNQQKEKLISWIEHTIQSIDCSQVKDPGHVVIRRLNNSEYDNTIRDLTGIDYKLSKNFPVTGGGGEGFDNNSEVQFFPPIMLEKLLDAAITLSQHTDISYTRGIHFSKQTSKPLSPAQYYKKAEFDFNVFIAKQRKPHKNVNERKTQTRDYALAAMTWILIESKKSDTQLKSYAIKQNLSYPVLANFVEYLNREDHKGNPWAMWTFKDWSRFKASPSSQHNMKNIEMFASLWNQKNHYLQKNIYRFEKKKFLTLEHDLRGAKKIVISIGDAGDGHDFDYALLNDARITLADGTSQNLRDLPLISFDSPSKMIHDREGDTQLSFYKDKTPIKQATQIQAPALLAYQLPKNTVSFKAQLGLSEKSEGNGLIQVHVSTKAAFYPMPLSYGAALFARPGKAARKTREQMAKVFNFVFKKVFNEKQEHIVENLPVQKQIIYQELKEERKLAKRWPSRDLDEFLQKENNGLVPDLKTLQTWEQKKQVKYRKFQKDLNKTKALLNLRILEHLETFTEKAYRRPLKDGEFQVLKSLYLQAMKREDNFQKAARLVLQKVFISPHFLYRFEDNKYGDKPQAISDIELANRLSYFLWNSMPDQALMEDATKGILHQDEILDSHVERMLKDPKSIALSKSFASQWLGIYKLKGERKPNARLYPEYHSKIRDAMIKEAELFFHDMVQNNQSVLSLIHSQSSYLNSELAEFYGVKAPPSPSFQKVNLKQAQRGGLLGMGAIHVATSYPDRSSPVLRGHWILETILGNPTPPPPEDLEIDEAALNNKKLSMRERLAQHSQQASCAICHDRMDPIGFTLESFNAIGKKKNKQADDVGILKSGQRLQGLEGLKQYILNERKDDYLEHFSAKLLGYALGRSLDYYDDCIIDELVVDLKKNKHQFSTLVKGIVKSLPFRYRRAIPPSKS